MAGTTSNRGSQRIGWKFSTPLQADYLNTFLYGVATQGLLSRITFSETADSDNKRVLVLSPFSVLIHPEDTEHKAVKITTTEQTLLPIGEENVIVMEFDFKSQSQWYADFKLYKGFNSSSKGVIIGQKLPNGVWTCEGCDFSTGLLFAENKNPMCWLSFKSPRNNTLQDTDALISRLVLRFYNKEYDNNYYKVDNTIGITGTVKIDSNLKKTTSDYYFYKINWAVLNNNGDNNHSELFTPCVVGSPTIIRTQEENGDLILEIN